MNLDKIIKNAYSSNWGRRKLNLALWLGIPFNRPHKIKIVEMEQASITTTIPYRKKNFNHIRGIHACGLATAAEFCSGFFLLSRLGTKSYRLIMESIEVKYHYQARMDAFASFGMSEEELQSRILSPLQTEEKVYVRCEIPVHDKQGNHLCTAYTNWQIKSWDKVRTK